MLDRRIIFLTWAPENDFGLPAQKTISSDLACRPALLATVGLDELALARQPAAVRLAIGPWPTTRPWPLSCGRDTATRDATQSRPVLARARPRSTAAFGPGAFRIARYGADRAEHVLVGAGSASAGAAPHRGAGTPGTRACPKLRRAAGVGPLYIHGHQWPAVRTSGSVHARHLSTP